LGVGVVVGVTKHLGLSSVRDLEKLLASDFPKHQWIHSSAICCWGIFVRLVDGGDSWQ
jgi:hypothetical protein